MSATTSFDEEYANYTDQMNAYKDRALQIKELAAMKPEDAFTKVGQELASQLGIHMFTKGLENISSSGKSTFQFFKNRVNDGVNRVRASADEVTQQINDVGDTLQESMSNLGNTVADNILPSNYIVSRITNEAGTEMKTFTSNITPEYSSDFYQRLPDLSEISFSDPSDLIPDGVTQASETFAGFRDARNPIEIQDYDEEGLSSYGWGIPKPQPGSTSNRLGDLIRQNPPQSSDAEAAQKQGFEMGQDISETQSKLGVTSQQATDIVESGRATIPASEVGDSDLGSAGTIAAETIGEDVGEDVGEAAAETAVEAAGVAAAPETLGLSLVLTGVTALAGAIGSIFGHHKSEPAPVQTPNLAVPTFIPGLSSN